jgi:TolB-like protein
MSDPGKAVFLSYASQDAEAARRIADALRAAGVEVWFDQEELRGGDAWDAKIRRQIHECAFFVPVISQHTQARAEGYFRREWRLGVERTHDMAEDVAFIVPVVIDNTPDATARVPDKFREVQWTRLPGGEVSNAFVDRVAGLLGMPRAQSPARGSESPRSPHPTARSEGKGRPVPWVRFWLAGASVVLIAVVGLFGWRESRLARPVEVADTKSIAVLPFANLSPDPENAFFTDGMHEDVITCLAKIRDLKVISRTSVLAYKGVLTRNLRTIAAELGVANVLEGSVQRAGNRVKVTAQLIDARTDQHVWADTYERDLADIFAIQGEIAQRIAAELKANLTQSERALIQRRPTHDQEAYDLYLQARDVASDDNTGPRVQELCEQALARDPNFALPYGLLSEVYSIRYWTGTILSPTPESREKARLAIEALVRLAPDQPETHFWLGWYYYRCWNDWARARQEFLAAQIGLPNEARIAVNLGYVARRLGLWSEALAHFTRADQLDPRAGTGVYVNNPARFSCHTLFIMRRFADARALADRALPRYPNHFDLLQYRIRSQWALDGDLAAYVRDLEAFPAAVDQNWRERTAALVAYYVALARDDLDAAEQALANSELTHVSSDDSAIQQPVAQFRAGVALARGRLEEARAFADQTVECYRAGKWTERQESWVLMGMAQAHAFAGRADEALRDARAALAKDEGRDAVAVASHRAGLGRVYAALGMREEALACLRTLMTEACSMTPQEIRHDPIWARLKDDPRFEEILRSAKPL